MKNSLIKKIFILCICIGLIINIISPIIAYANNVIEQDNKEEVKNTENSEQNIVENETNNIVENTTDNNLITNNVENNLNESIEDKNSIMKVETQNITNEQKFEEYEAKGLDVVAISYIDGKEWSEPVISGETSGTEGKNLKMNAIKLKLLNAKENAHIKYSTYIENKGWQDTVKDGEISGDIEENKKLYGISIEMENMAEYSIEYRAHIENEGWSKWYLDGEKIERINQKTKIEAIQVKIISKTIRNTTSGNISKTEITNEWSINYSAHVQDIGWQSEVKNGMQAGTTGKNKKIEALKINLSNSNDNIGIKYSTYLEGKSDWQDWSKNGEVSGTTGQNRKMYAIKIELINLSDYTVKYRVHLQDIGWQDWKKDGEVAGYIDKYKKIEAIEIRLEKKTKGELTVRYKSHVQDIGWQDEKINGEISGTSGQNKKIEALQIELENNDVNTGIEYSTYIEGKGWQDWKSNGEISGTTGQNKKIYGVRIKLIDIDSKSIQYRVHIQDYGWTEWKVDGAKVGNINKQKKIEAIQIRIIDKTGNYDDEEIAVKYMSHVSNKGWEEEYLAENGEISGTVGQALKLEGIKIKLCNVGKTQKILYRAHVQDIGWQEWCTDEELAGTIGQNKKIEAIQIKLQNMDNYTVEYRAHVQDEGWQDWKIDGEVAGTTGKNRRIEAMQIRIVPKYKREYNGIDVSYWNGHINWNYVQRSGIDFAMIRIGYRGYGTSGTLVEDTLFNENMQGALNAGIKVGVYFFTQAINRAEAVEEANWVINKLNERGYASSITYPIAIDTESTGTRRSGKS